MPETDDMLRAHDERISDHAARLDNHDELIKKLQAADVTLEADIRRIHQKMSSGFSEVKDGIQKIHSEALSSIPERFASRMSTHLLVWTIVGSMALVFAAVVGVVSLIK